MTRTAILISERDVRIGKTMVPEATTVIRHGDTIFVRTQECIRLVRGGTGVGAVFRETEVIVRNALEPI